MILKAVISLCCNFEELFECFTIHNREAGIGSFLKSGDPSVTRVEIPAEYNGLPVKSIASFAFLDCKFLREVFIPDSVEWIDAWAFQNCPELRRVRVPNHVGFELLVFQACPKLSPETVAMGLVRSTDITSPISNNDLREALLNPHFPPSDLFRADVFEILAKNNCFGKCDTTLLFERMTYEGKTELFPLAEQYGMLNSEPLVDGLIEYSAEHGKTEITAYLLDYKNRKFGFKGFDDFEGGDKL